MTAALEGGEWSAVRPGRTLPPGNTRYPFYTRLGGPPGPVCTGGKSRPNRDSIPDRPARSQSPYRLSYRPTLLRFTATNSGEQTVALYRGLSVSECVCYSSDLSTITTSNHSRQPRIRRTKFPDVHVCAQKIPLFFFLPENVDVWSL